MRELRGYCIPFHSRNPNTTFSWSHYPSSPRKLNPFIQTHQIYDAENGHLIIIAELSLFDGGAVDLLSIDIAGHTFFNLISCSFWLNGKFETNNWIAVYHVTIRFKCRREKNWVKPLQEGCMLSWLTDEQEVTSDGSISSSKTWIVESHWTMMALGWQGAHAVLAEVEVEFVMSCNYSIQHYFLIFYAQINKFNNTTSSKLMYREWYFIFMFSFTYKFR